MKSRRRALLSVPAILLFASTFAGAQQFPTRPIRLVVNFAAGGTTDVMARALAKPLASILGQSIVIDNKTGALGAIGAAEVGRAAPDGYTLLLTTQGSLTEIPVLNPQVHYNPLTAFAPITLVGESPLVLIAHPSFPANDVKGLIAYAKSQPGGIDISVTGSSVKLGTYALAGAAGIDLVQVPYAGQGPAMTAALAGHTKLALNTSSTALMQYVQTGKLKLLGVATEKPYPLLPGVPTIAATVPGFTSKAWWGVFAPGGTPPAVVEALNKAFKKALAEPGMEDLFHANAVSPVATTPAELAKLVVTGLEETRRLVKQYNIPME
jgi:tripartite-type tricarboxylate transporter receptor subunit TctC